MNSFHSIELSKLYDDRPTRIYFLSKYPHQFIICLIRHERFATRRYSVSRRLAPLLSKCFQITKLLTSSQQNLIHVLHRMTLEVFYRKYLDIRCAYFSYVLAAQTGKQFNLCVGTVDVKSSLHKSHAGSIILITMEINLE